MASEEDEEGKEIDIEGLPDPWKDIKALENNLRKAQKDCANAANDFGFQLDVVKAVGPFWLSTPSGANMPTASGAEVIHRWREQSEIFAKESGEMAASAYITSGTANYVAANTATYAQLYPPTPSFDVRPILEVAAQRTEQEFVTAQLTNIDAGLGKTYATIWQYIHLPAFDPFRGPLYLMRQVLDYFLAKLAPDEKVESQSGFQPDDELKKRNGKGITRKHRIEYIADTKVRDPNERVIVLKSTKGFTEVYEGLNEAHKRGSLDEEAARSAVYQGNALLAKWLETMR